MASGERNKEFRTLLTRVAEHLKQDNLESLAFIHNLPPAEEKRSGLEVLVLLEQRGDISATNVQQLKVLLSSVNRQDVISTCGVVEYEEMSKLMGENPPTQQLQTRPAVGLDLNRQPPPPQQIEDRRANYEQQGSEVQFSVEDPRSNCGYFPDSTVPPSLVRQQQCPDGSPSPPLQTCTPMSLTRDELGSLGNEQKRMVVEAVLEDKEMKAQVLSSLGPALLRSLQTSSEGSQAPTRSYSEGELFHRCGESPRRQGVGRRCREGPVIAKHDKSLLPMSMQYSMEEESSLSSAASGDGSPGGSLNLRGPPVQQQASRKASSSSTPCRVSSHSSFEIEACIVHADDISHGRTIKPRKRSSCDSQKSSSESSLSEKDNTRRKPWKLKREELCKSVFSHKQKCYTKDFMMKVDGAKSKPVKVTLKLYANGIESDTNNSMTMGVLVTAEEVQVRDTAMLNLTLLTRMGPEEQEEFISSKEVRESLGNFVIYDFMPHEVLKRCHSKYVEIVPSVHLTFDKYSCADGRVPKEDGSTDGFVAN